MNEDRYYGSDLNKWGKRACTDEMTLINIDMLTFKRSTLTLRIIESKHSREPLPESQLEALEYLAQVFKFWNKHHERRGRLRTLRTGVYVIRGNHPYRRVIVTDVITGKKKRMSKKELVRFLQSEGD